MPLDLDFTPYYKLTLPISKKKVEYRPYLVGEEISFLTHLETEDVTDLINSILNLTTNCVKDQSAFEGMDIVDFSYLTANIRAKSKGEEITIPRTCPECNTPIEAIFDISKDLKIKNEKNTQLVVSVADDISIEIGVLPYTHLIGIVGVEQIDEEADSELLTIASCIKKVVHKGKIYSDLTLEEIYNGVVKRMPTKQLEKLVREMKNLPIIYGVINFECQCGHKEKVEVDNVLNFLS